MDRPANLVARLRILATSDVHMHLLPFDYLNDRPTPGTGLAPLADIIAKCRREAAAEDPPRHVLLVDNGDTLQGTALGDHLAGIRPRDGTHPLAQVMNALGYDAMGLGNHDLDFGLEYLGWFAQSLTAPLISSNFTPGKAQDWLQPHAILHSGGIAVGVLSVLPPGTVGALRAQIGDAARVRGMVDTVKRTARHLTASGADIVLGLAHTGLRPTNTDNALAEIARSGAIHALVGGHTHAVFPGTDAGTGTLHGVPTVMPGFAAAHLGCIDLDLERRPDTGEGITTASARLLTADRAADQASEGCDPAFDPIRPAHAATCAAMGEVIAQTPVPLTSYFAQVRPTRIHAIAAAAQRAEIDALRQDTRLASLPLLSAVSLARAGGNGGCRNYTDIPAGPLTVRHLSELSLYSNFVWAVQVSGAELAEWLERAASAFAQVGGGRSGLLDNDFPAFDFDVIHGVHCEVDPRMPARYDRAGRLRRPDSRRIAALTHGGAPIAPDTQFLVAVNSFRACGGGNFPGLHPDRAVLRPELSVADAIRTWLEAGHVPPDDPPWRFAAACKGTETWFETGPRAHAHLEDIANLSPGTPQQQASGFLRIPITL